MVDLEYAPVGFGSYHWRVLAAGERWFVTVDDLQAKRRDESAFEGPQRRLTAALATARLLNEGGLGFVVAPVPTVTGEVLYLVDERYAVAVYPHVEGESHD